VARPGDLIDRNINSTETGLNTTFLKAGIPLGAVGAPVGPTAPNFTFRDTTYWAQGINFGLEFRW